jgi:hypothetical protein
MYICKKVFMSEVNYNVSDELKDERSVSFNKNETQSEFNSVKGTIIEINEAEKHAYVVLSLGKQRKRIVYISMKKDYYKQIINKFSVDDKVLAKFYVTSFEGTNNPVDATFKKYYTVCSLIEMELLP